MKCQFFGYSFLSNSAISSREQKSLFPTKCSEKYFAKCSPKNPAPPVIRIFINLYCHPEPDEG